MFDIGFSELVVCFLVALVVLGPEKLPRVARTLGRWSGQAKGYLRNLSAELDREGQLAELRKQLDDAHRAMQDGAREFKDELKSGADSVRDSLRDPDAPEPPAIIDSGDKPDDTPPRP